MKRKAYNLKKPPKDFLRYYTEVTDTYYRTQGHRKLLNYFKEVVKSDGYKTTLTQIRKKFKIPKKGFPYNKKLPILPSQWVYSNNRTKIRLFRTEIKQLCKQYSIHYMDWVDPIETHIFYNTYNIPAYQNSYNLCLISEISEEREQIFGKEFRESDDMAYPILIRISPYASLRDIMDYVKKLYAPAIQPIQQKYKNNNTKIGKFKRRKPSIEERNIFVYNNRNLPRKQIMALVADKFKEVIDYGHIAKIISLEKDRRKKL